ncbi:hypothetical protein BH18ACI4_BH18ACI4_07270 [soil metagenome]
MLVLNEPETSLHPDLLPALGRLIAKAAERSQALVVTHAPRLIAALEEQQECNSVMLEKELVKPESLEQTSWRCLPALGAALGMHLHPKLDCF